VVSGSRKTIWSSSAACSSEEAGVKPRLWVHMDSREWRQGTTMYRTRQTVSDRSRTCNHKAECDVLDRPRTGKDSGKERGKERGKR